MERILATVRSLYSKVIKFGVVGTVGVGTDFAASNILWKYTGLDRAVAGVFGTAVATVVGYIGSRYWVFRDRPDEDRRRDMTLFALFSLFGMIIENGAIFVNDHVFGFHSQLAANVAKYGFGLVVAGAFRFWAFNVFVFPQARAAAAGAVVEPRSGDISVDADAVRAVRNGVS